jgi:hypothetical protein
MSFLFSLLIFTIQLNPAIKNRGFQLTITSTLPPIYQGARTVKENVNRRKRQTRQTKKSHGSRMCWLTSVRDSENSWKVKLVNRTWSYLKSFSALERNTRVWINSHSYSNLNFIVCAWNSSTFTFWTLWSGQMYLTKLPLSNMWVWWGRLSSGRS